MPLEFFDPSHASLRLGNTIVRVNDSPVLLGAVDDNYSVSLLWLHSNKTTIAKDIRTIQGIDLTPVPLGFCLHDRQVSYLMRRPTRRAKQGLSEDALYVDGRPIPRFTTSPSFRKALGNTIVGDYPSISKARKMLGDELICVPISRNWAIFSEPRTKEQCLLYKFEGKVASWSPEEKKFVLSTDYMYLYETMEQELANA